MSDIALVTGASGFVGSAVARALVKRGLHVRVLMRPFFTGPMRFGMAMRVVMQVGGPIMRVRVRVQPRSQAAAQSPDANAD